ncbi:outer membrane protein assembly factor BamA [Paralimibaculum aggregatum]|nr:outer membrane protein assembly factor BamA [Limibaculum sp. NKW23]
MSAHAQVAGAGQGAQSQIVIRGNRRIEPGTIISYMALPSDRAITAEDLNAATRRLFDTGLFRDVRVIPADRGIVVEVQENPSINEIAFEGNDIAKDEDLLRIISSRPRFPFTPATAESDAQAIIEIYRRTGRYGAQVEPVIIERSENRVDLVFEIDEGEMTGVSSIDFVGNRAFSDSRLRDEIETRESDFLSVFFSSDVYDPDRLELDKALLRQFYLSRGYADFSLLSATAELAPDRTGFFITFDVEEGEQYTFGEFDVQVNAEGLDAEDFLALIPAEDLTGETYDATEVEEIANELTDLAGEKGFAFVRVQPRADKDTEDRIIDITFELSEGSRIFIERIDIEGNTATLDRVIRREVELVEGDAFDARKIRLTRSAIRGLGYFERVEVEAEPGSGDDRAVLKVKVAEKSTGSINFGIGYSSSAGPIGTVAVTERNFLGRGQIVNATVTAAGDTQVYDLSFTEPKFLDRDLAVTMRGFFIQDDRDDESSFQLNRAGFEPSVAFPLSEDATLQLDYSFSRDDLEAAFNASPAIQVDDGSRFKSSVGYTLSYDKRNDRIEPTGGYLARINQEFAGLGGDAQFVKTRASIKGWQGFFDDDLVASIEVEGGALFTFGDDTRVNDRFFIGGNSLRGFAAEGIGPRDTVNASRDAVGGNFFGVVRAQVSFPIGLPEELGIYGGAFVDAGTLWGLNRTYFDAPAGNTSVSAVTIDDDPKIRVAAGGLLFIDSPFGPIELSVGFPIVKEDFDDDEIFRVSVGTRF